MEAYCVRCKQKRPMSETQATFTANGTPATKGICPVCGTTLYRMGRTPAHEGMRAPELAARPAKRSGKASIARKGDLVIVESPAKARTVGRYLGKGFRVKASIGHVRDLLRSQLSVDVDNGFEPRYRVPNEKKAVVKELKADAAKAEQVFLATDPDREGEAIAWHLIAAAEIEPDRAKRVAFNEITEEGIRLAFQHPRDIDMDLVDAQQARRILDRLVGYNISPILWSKVRSRLSAGRVQSAALRLIVDREREIEAFQPREYWSIDGRFTHPDTPPDFLAGLVKIDGQDPDLPDRASVDRLLDDLRDAAYRVSEVKRGTRNRNPAPPFTTSTLQQSASRRLGFTARKTMAVAQQLYEGLDLGHDDPVGLITYMRTDSTQVSTQAQAEARRVVQSRYGPDFLPAEPPIYKTQARRAQEAHEAIRPTSSQRMPETIKPFLTSDQRKLYDLIWSRFIASQMAPAIYDTMTIEIVGQGAAARYLFRLAASSMRFAGFLRAYADKRLEDVVQAEQDDRETDLSQLPDLAVDDPLRLLALLPEQHFTMPPARYSDASLVKALEEHGIGRPSTYAPILNTIQKRGYVRREQRRLHPTDIGRTVNDLVVEHFPEIVDLGFTARLEQELDEIAEGERNWDEVIEEFYGPFSEQVERAQQLMPELRAEPEPLERNCPESGHPLVIRHGRFGKFIGCSDFPNCRYTEPWLEKVGVKCPEDGGDLVERRTRKGRIFYGCSNYPACEFTTWNRPVAHPCPKCGGLLVHQKNGELQCLQCSSTYPESQFQRSESELA